MFFRPLNAQLMPDLHSAHLPPLMTDLNPCLTLKLTNTWHLLHVQLISLAEHMFNQHSYPLGVKRKLSALPPQQHKACSLGPSWQASMFTFSQTLLEMLSSPFLLCPAVHMAVPNQPHQGMLLGEQEINSLSRKGPRIPSKLTPPCFHVLMGFTQPMVRVKSRLDVAGGDVLVRRTRAMEWLVESSVLFFFLSGFRLNSTVLP